MNGMLRAIRKKHIKLLISVAVIAALGFGMTAGLICGYDSLERSLNSYVREYRYPDAVITTEVTTTDAADPLREVDGVLSCGTRLFADTTMRDSGGKNLTVRAFSYAEEETQGFVFWSRAEIGGDAVLIERKFADSNGICAGDEVSFRVDGVYRSCFVAGIVSRPETLAAKINDDAWGVNYDFGYVYVPLSLLKKEYEKDYAEKKYELDEKSDEFDHETESAKRLLDDKLNELETAKNLLDEQKQALDGAKLEADTMAKNLTNERQKLVSSRDSLDRKRDQLNSAIAALQEKEQELPDRYNSLKEAKEGLAAIDASLSELRQIRNALSDTSALAAVDELSDLIGTLDMPMLNASVREMRARVAAARDAGDIDAMVYATSGLVDYLMDLEEQVRLDYDYLNSTQAMSLIAGIAVHDELPAGDPAYRELLYVLERYSGETITSSQQLITVYTGTVQGLALLTDAFGRMDLPGVSASLNSMDVGQLSDDAIAFLEAAEEQGGAFDGSLSGLYRGILSSVETAVGDLESRRAGIVAALGENGVKENQIDATLKSVADGIEQCRTQRVEAQNGIAKIDDGLIQIDDGIAEIDAALKEITSKLSENTAKLDDAEEEIKTNEAELNRRTAVALRERSEIEEELRNAYALLDENNGYDTLCNEFMLYFDQNADPDAVLKKAVAALGDIRVKHSYTYADSAVKTRINENLDPIRTLMVLLPIAFFVIVLIVIFLFMSMIIKQSRREIGILRALGFTRGRVRGMFCIIGLLVSAAGLIPGALIGAGLTYYVGSYFADFFPLPEFSYSVSFFSVILAAAATVVVTLAATLLSTGSIARIMPDEAMSRQVQTPAKIPALLRPLIDRLRPMPKFSATSLMRSKGRFVISTVCIAASATLIFAAVSFIASKNFTVRQVFGERIRYDCQLFFEETPSNELISRLSGLGYIDEIETVAYREVDVYAGGRSESVILNAIEEGSALIGVTDRAGRELSVSRGGIILERHTADALGVKEGDTVFVNAKELTVAAISDQCVNRIQYIALADADILGQPDLGCLVCNYSGDRKQELLSLLLDTEGYLYAVFTDSLYADNSELYATYDLAAWIVILFAVLIGFVIVLNTMLTNLHENKKELAILRTLGFLHGEIGRSRLVQSLFQLLIACLIGFPPGAATARAMLASISTPLTEYVYVGGAAEFLFTGGLVLLYLLLSHAAAMRSMKKWDVTEIVKDKE